MDFPVYRVTVSKTAPPVFPEWCPVCSSDWPEHDLTLRCVAWTSTAPNLRCWWPFCWIRMPGCSDCDHQLKWSTYRRRLAFLGCITGGTLFLNDMFGWGQVGSRTAFYFGALFSLPIVLWEMQHPRPVDLYIADEGLMFIFTNRDYALEFAEFNGAELEPPDDVGWMEAFKHAIKHWHE